MRSAPHNADGLLVDAVLAACTDIMRMAIEEASLPVLAVMQTRTIENPCQSGDNAIRFVAQYITMQEGWWMHRPMAHR